MDYFTQKCVWKDVSAMEEPFELAVLAAVRGEDGKLRLRMSLRERQGGGP